MKKYIYLDLKKHMNHKMIFCDYADIDPVSESEGVMGLYVLKENMDFERKVKYLKDGGVEIIGAREKADNIRCQGQVIDLPDTDYKKILIVGFHETGSYSDIVKLVDEEGNVKEKKIMLYQMLENLDLLYECDLDEKSKVAFSIDTNAMIKMHYFAVALDVESKYRQLILPYNEEAHIAAISLVK